MPTLPDLLAHRLRRDPGRPFVTYYDEDSGERTELSVTTYANWVAKVANLLTDELMLDPGDRIRVELPPHWLGAVFLGAAHSTGIDVAEDGPVAAYVVGPEPVPREGTTLACALLPFAVRYPTPTPADVSDFGTLWPGQSDVFVPVAATELASSPDDRRVLTDLDPTSEEGARLLVDLLAGDGSLVLLRGSSLTDEQWRARHESERATAILRSGQPID